MLIPNCKNGSAKHSVDCYKKGAKSNCTIKPRTPNNVKLKADNASSIKNNHGQGNSNSTVTEAIRNDRNVMVMLQSLPINRSSRSVSAAVTTPKVKGMVILSCSPKSQGD